MVAAMNGRIITARISEAVKMPVPNAGPWNSAPITGTSLQPVDQERLRHSCP